MLINPNRIFTLNNNFPKRKKDIVYIIGDNINNFNSIIPFNAETIAVNKSIYLIDKIDYFITMNHSFLIDIKNFNEVSKATNKVFIINKTLGFINKLSNNTYIDSRFNYKYSKIINFNYVIESNIITDLNTGFSLDINKFASGNISNFCALQLAILMGYKEIHLYGFEYTTNSNTDVNKKIVYRNTFLNSIKLLPDNIKTKIIVEENNTFLKNDILNNNTTIILPNNQSKDIIPENINITNNKIIIIGYYTKNTPYEIEKNKLIESINKFKYNSYIKPIDNLGDWNLNTKYKAVFLLECLMKYPNQRLLYVDVDAIILKPLDLFNNYKADIALRIESWRWRQNEYLSGTIYLESNPRTIKIIKEWINVNNNSIDNEKQLEQWNFGIVIDKYKNTKELIFKVLPPEYTYIYDLSKRKYPDLEPVIIHNQASRKNKNAVKTNFTKQIPNKLTNSNINKFIITDELFKDNECFSNKINNNNDKELFYLAVQNKSLELLKKYKSIYPNKKIINFVMSNHWGWVFSYIIDKYTEYATDYIVIPSIYPIPNSDVYQYFRPVHKKTKLFFNDKNNKSEFYNKGIHMVHDSFFDIYRNDTAYRLSTIKNYKYILCTSKEQLNYLTNLNIKNTFYNPLGINKNIKLKEKTNYTNKINIGFNARNYADNVKQTDLFSSIIFGLNKNDYIITILSPNLNDIVINLKNKGYTVLTSFNKSQDEFDILYKNIDILLITSKYEGTPLPLIESLKYGHTVISTKVGEAPVYLDSEYLLNNKNDFIKLINKINLNRDLLEQNRIINNNKVKELTWKLHVENSIRIWEKIIKK